MEQKILYIQHQLWFVIALFLLLIATNIVCYFSRKAGKSKEPNFGDMWNKGEIDSLIKKAREYLIEYPNNTGALYFCAKALVAKRTSLPEAKEYLNKVVKNNPNVSVQVQEIIDEIQKMESS